MFPMLQDIFILLWTFCILMLPLVFWMYIFVSFFQYRISRFQFFLWVLIGWFLTFFFIGYKYILGWRIFEEIFFQLSLVGNSLFSGKLLLAFSIFFLIFTLWTMIVSFFFQENKKLFFKNILLFLGSIFFFVVICTGLIDFFSGTFWSKTSGISVGFWDFLFSTLGSIIAYYIVISLLEEGGKYIGQLWFAGRKEFSLFQAYILLSACIALGFSFFENIFYTYSSIVSTGVSSSLFTLVFFRSIFSISLHISCSILFALAFWHIFDFFKTKRREKILFFLFLPAAILSHMVFDLSLTFWYIWILFFYILFLYMLLSYITTTSE